MLPYRLVRGKAHNGCFYYKLNKYVCFFSLVMSEKLFRRSEGLGPYINYYVIYYVIYINFDI